MLVVAIAADLTRRRIVIIDVLVVARPDDAVGDRHAADHGVDAPTGTDAIERCVVRLFVDAHRAHPQPTVRRAFAVVAAQPTALGVDGGDLLLLLGV